MSVSNDKPLRGGPLHRGYTQQVGSAFELRNIVLGPRRTGRVFADEERFDPLAAEVVEFNDQQITLFEVDEDRSRPS